MAKVRKVDFSPDEFLVGIAGMKPIDIAVYWVVCSLQMSSGKAVNINDSRLFSIIDIRSTAIQAAISRLVAASKLHRNGDELANNRVRKEIKSAVKRIQTARKNGAKGGRPRNEINEIENPPGSDAGLQPEKLSPSPSPPPSSEGKKERSSNDGGQAPPPPSQGLPNVIQTPKAILFGQCREFLIANGAGDENARKMLGKWAKVSSDAIVIEVVSEAMAKAVQEPISWIEAALKQRGYGAQQRRRFTV